MLLPAISKIVEHAIQEQIVNHMNTVVPPNQQAYLKDYITTLALLQLSDQMFEALEDKLISIALSIDQSSAFYSICHVTLDIKVKLYGLNVSTRNWVKS